VTRRGRTNSDPCCAGLSLDWLVLTRYQIRLRVTGHLVPGSCAAGLMLNVRVFNAPRTAELSPTSFDSQLFVEAL